MLEPSKKKKVSGFKALRDLPPPSPEKLAQYQAGFPERLKMYERQFIENSKIERVSEQWMDRSYDL